MPRTTPKWIIFLAVLAGGLLVTLATDLAMRYPNVLAAVVWLAFILSGRLAPLDYTLNALTPLRHAAAWRGLVRVALLAGISYAIYQAATVDLAHGALVLLAIQLADIVIAWPIRHGHTWYWRRRRARRRQWQDLDQQTSNVASTGDGA
jgi:hypothetical protein